MSDAKPRSTCPWCGATGTMFIASVLVAKPLGTWSLSGNQLKTVASKAPVLVCRSCKHESVGWIEPPRHVNFDPQNHKSELTDEQLANRETELLREV